MPQRPDYLPSYLRPYAAAAERHGGGFRSLLWASQATQAARFKVFTRLADFRDKTVLDVGCGRADLLDFLIEAGCAPAHYVGLEALEPLVQAAEAKKRPRSLIVSGDFVRDAIKMFVGADIVVFSGSLNTLSDEDFYATLRRAYDATAGELIFNYLDSPTLAAAQYLTWRKPGAVRKFIEMMSPRVMEVSDYLEGDRTILAGSANA